MLQKEIESILGLFVYQGNEGAFDKLHSQVVGEAF
jgi:hypothetical protein